MTLNYIWQRIVLAFIAKAGSKTRIKYWRSRGMKIGTNCLINNVSFSTEPYLIEIGDHVAIAAGTEFITHDGAIWCFRDEIKNADIFGRIFGKIFGVKKIVPYIRNIHRGERVLLFFAEKSKLGYSRKRSQKIMKFGAFLVGS